MTSTREWVTSTLRRWRPGLLLGAAIFLLHTVSPSPQPGDSRLSVIVAWQLLTSGSIDLAGVPAVEILTAKGDLISGPGGSLLPFFPWPPMLLALPGALLLALVGIDPAGLSISDPNETWIVEVPTASVLVAVTAVLIRRLVLDSRSPWATPVVGWVSALAFAFTTIAWSTGSRALWQQTVSMLIIVLTLLAVQRREQGGPWPWLIGAFAALALVMRPTNAVVVAPLVIWMLAQSRRELPSALIGGVAVLLPFFVLSWTFYGTPLPSYYLPSRLGDAPVWEFAESLAVHLVSPGRGLLIYVPLVMLSIAGVAARIARRSLTSLDLALIASVIAQIIVVSRFGSTNGFTYGPRLLMDVVPLLVLLAAPSFAALRLPRPRRALPVLAATGVAAVLAVGLFVNATGALSRTAVCWNVTPVKIDEAPERVWDWADPPFLRPWRVLVTGTPLLVGTCPTATGASETP